AGPAPQRPSGGGRKRGGRAPRSPPATAQDVAQEKQGMGAADRDDDVAFVHAMEIGDGGAQRRRAGGRAIAEAGFLPSTIPAEKLAEQEIRAETFGEIVLRRIAGERDDVVPCEWRHGVLGFGPKQGDRMWEDSRFAAHPSRRPPLAGSSG